MRQTLAVLLVAAVSCLGDELELHGSGTTNPSRLFYKRMNILMSGLRESVRMSYRAVGSSTGQSDFLVDPRSENNTHFACGDIPLTQAVYATVTATEPVVHVPFALGTISVFANLPVEKIQLSPCTITKIYLQQITMWDDAAIIDENPNAGTALAGMPIILGRRLLGSSSTFGITQYMDSLCSATWPHGHSATALAYLSESATVKVVQGSSGMTAFIKETVGAIGYIDSGHGVDNGLMEVSLQLVKNNPTDPEVYAVSTSSLVKASEAATRVTLPNPEDSWDGFSLMGQPEPAWPITMVSYFYILKNISVFDDVTKGTSPLIKLFVDDILSDDGQAETENFGFTKLGASFLDTSRDTVANLLDLGSETSYVFERATMTGGSGNNEKVVSTKRNPDPFDAYEVQKNIAELQALSQANEEAIDALETEQGEAISGVLEHITQQRGNWDVPLVGHTAVTVAGFIYVIGGCYVASCTIVSNVIYRYDPRTEDVTQVGTLQTGRHGHVAARIGIRIFISGGKGGTGGFADGVEVFDTVSLDVSQVSTDEMHERFGASAFELDDKIHVCGGMLPNDSVTADCYSIDSVHATASLPPLWTARAFHRAATIGDTAYIFGGIDSRGSTIGLMEILEGAAGWSAHPVKLTGLARKNAGMVALHGRLYVIAGLSTDASSNDVYTRDVYAFVPGTTDHSGVTTGTWFRAGEMIDLKASFAFAVKGDAVYLFGGVNAGGILQSVSRYLEQPALFEIPVTPMHGSGTTNPSRFFWKWMDILQARIRLPVKMTYRAIGSSSGMKDFRGNNPVTAETPSHVDFACGDIPLTNTIYTELTNAGREVLQVPFALGAISVFANLPVTSIRLSPCTLSKVFMGTITKWNDPTILAENPDVADKLDGIPITVGRRQHGSSSTFGTSQYMDATCPTVWTRGYGASGMDDLTHATIVQGSSGMTNFIQTTSGAIGYIDSGHGIDNNLLEVALDLPTEDNSFLSATSADASIDIGSAADVVDASDIPLSTADWSSFSLMNKVRRTGAATGPWPITMVSYFYLNRDMTGRGITGSLLKAFLTNCLSDEGQTDLEEFGFVKLSPTFLSRSRSALEEMYLSLDVEEFVFEVETMDPVNGMGDYVISSKRNPDPFDFYHIESGVETLTSRFSQVETTSETLQQAQSEQTATLASLQQEVEALQARLGLGPSVEDDDDSTIKAIAIASLILSILSLLVGIGIGMFAMRKVSHRSLGEPSEGATEPSVRA
ncbi:Phosphate-binding protein PstS [Diplonema papillatum]|nr:Phosphate-binding protein PstS [Diplonema papillatum]